MSEAQAVGGLVHTATGAAWWGAEIDTQFRVVALTIEPAAERYPSSVVPDDRRLQVLLHPVNAITLVHRVDGTLITAQVEDLLDLVESLDGAPLVAAAVPQAGPWAAEPSLAGRSDAPDGRTHGLWLRARFEKIAIDLHVTFDELEVRTPEGDLLSFG